jgi:aldose sugar dehydrogenase
MKYLVYLSTVILLLTNSCGSSADDTTNPVDNENSNAPVESDPRDAPSQQPAFDGQTRVPAVQTQSDYSVTVVATGLVTPWGLDFLPDGRMIVSERSGNIRIVSLTGSIGGHIANVPPVRTGGDGGMLDIKIAPDFSTSRHVFWSYIEPQGAEGANCVARATLSANESTFENVEVIYRSDYYTSNRHTGSRMVFDSNGLLYVTFGDRYDNAVRDQAQQLDSSFGKIIRINQDGTAAAGNPFLTNERPEIWSYGHRNPQGLAFNPATGALWQSEHGPTAGDEINIIQSGGNYGWPVISYGIDANGQPVGTGATQQNGMEQPIYFWDPAIAPSGITFYTGSLISEWQNNLFVASLRGMHIVRLVINNSTNRVVGEERLLVDENQRFRHIVQGPDGALYALTDSNQGRIYRISN